MSGKLIMPIFVQLTDSNTEDKDMKRYPVHTTEKCLILAERWFSLSPGFGLLVSVRSRYCSKVFAAVSPLNLTWSNSLRTCHSPEVMDIYC